MMRVYPSVFAAVIRNVVFIRARLAAKEKTPRVLFPARLRVDRRKIIRTLSVVLVVSLLAAASPSARHTIAGLVRKSQSRVSSWTSSTSLSTKLSQTLADGYGRYENWLTARVTGKQHKTGHEVSSLPPAGHSTVTGSMPLVPTMVPPPPPDVPPTFSDDPLVVGTTFVQALHITELQDAVDLVRQRAGLPPASWGDGVASGLPIMATHIQDLRTQLDYARLALGLPEADYSPPAPGVGVGIRAAHVQEIREHIKDMFGMTANSDSAVARLDPLNQTGGGGENPLSRNYNWSVPLVGLPGRAGLDLGLSLSYNSLVWTKRGSSTISFDDDRGFPGPGFRLGFPVIQGQHYNSETQKYAHLLITPDGGRTELRQVNSSALYEAADSSHLLFDAANLVLRTTDGTQLSYVWKGNAYQCTEIKDRNGNFITITYTTFGQISTVVDTLGRVITFNYDGESLLSITQPWNGQPHTWASFEYNPVAEIETNFPSLTVLGSPQNNETIKVLSKVTLDDNSRFEFDYTYWGQIWKIRNYDTDGDLLNYRAYNLPGNWLTTQDDCPRFTERHDKAENWNRGGSDGPAELPAGDEQEVLTGRWIVPEAATWNLPDGTPHMGTLAQVTAVDETHSKIYFEGAAGTGTGWRRGLPSLVETWGSTTPGGSIIKQKSSVTTWKQDDENVSYKLNPRVEATNIYDFNALGVIQNRARTEITYYPPVSIGDGMSCRRPEDVIEYEADATTVLRRTHTIYVPLSSEYTSRRIIGLVSEKRLYAQVQTLMSKVTFAYDDPGSILGAEQPVHHDNTNYTASFVSGRANLTSATRVDVLNQLPSTTSTIRYNTSGSVVKIIDPDNHEMEFSYVDQFSANGLALDGARPATFAYPTILTDPDNYTSSTRYHYDFGAVTWKQTPKPNITANEPGPEQTVTYDSLGRIQRTTNLVNGAYTRYVYPSTVPGSLNRIDVYSTIVDGANDGNGLEAHSFKVFDGHSRVIASASSHPGDTAGFSGVVVLYDKMGRVSKQSNPTETSGSGTPSQWAAAGDDSLAGGLGWLYTKQTYDWKGRSLVTTNTDLSTKEASYAGCGCAGGAVVTVSDEGTVLNGVPKKRQQKIYSDVLGRTVKTELFNWQGGSIYSATVSSYNVRDQVTQVRQFQGAAPDPDDLSCPNGTCQKTTVDYDGHGRPITKHVPEQQMDPNNSASSDHTTWHYNADDTVDKITDARGTTQTLGYNARHLVTGITYAVPPGSTIPVTPNVTYSYDAAGNRVTMSDGFGGSSHGYDLLSRMISETRTFNDPINPTINGVVRSLGYTYNLGGQLSSITDPFNATINHGHDAAGRLVSVTGSAYAGVTTYVSGVKYRAWGAVKSAAFGNTPPATGQYNASETVKYNARLQPTEFRLTSTSLGFQSIRENYEYYPDGRLRTLTDLDDTSGTNPPATVRYLSRSFAYDHAGRFSFTSGLPAQQSFAYDVFGNLTGRSGSYYNQPYQSDSGTFTNNRRAGWNYDAEGQITSTPAAPNANARTLSHDAAGRLVQTVDTGASVTTTYTVGYDGDGRVLGESMQGPSNETNYSVGSAVLGSTLTTVTSAGAKRFTHVPAGGLVLPRQTELNPPNANVAWMQQNPMGVTETVANGGQVPAIYDALGNYIPHQYMSDPRPPMGAFSGASPGMAWQMMDPSNYGMGCMVDNLPTNCASAMRWMNSGVAAQCPDNNCGPRFNPHRDGRGRGGWETLWLFHSGFSYQPLGPSSRPPGPPPSLKWPPGKRPPSIPLGPANPGGASGGEGPVGDSSSDGEGPLGDTIIPVNYVSLRNSRDERVDFRNYAFMLSGNGENNDCLKLALMVYKAGQAWGGNPIRVVAGLLNGLTERAGIFGSSDPNYRVGVMRSDYYYGNSFGSGGFLPQYQGPPGDNQVRHFIGWFAAGFNLPHFVARHELYNQEGNSNMNDPDVALGVAAIELAGTYKIVSDYKNYKGLAQRIWRDICGGKGDLNLP